MLHALKGTLAFTFIALHTAFWCSLLYLGTLVRLIVPRALGKQRVANLMTRTIDGWVGSNRILVAVLRITQIRLSLDSAARLSRNNWYIVVSNHQSWTDILVLQNTLMPLIPPLKFFTKQQLIWVPFLGIAMKLLGFPYVRRYSREQLAKRPELREHDRQATVRACSGFKERPTSVLTFLEGTRFTPAKHAAQQSPYRHLLRPKPGGIGYVTEALEGHLEQILDVTIHYPDGVPGFWDFLCGRCQRVDVEITLQPLPGADVKQFVDALWVAKDARIETFRA